MYMSLRLLSLIMQKRQNNQFSFLCLQCLCMCICIVQYQYSAAQCFIYLGEVLSLMLTWKNLTSPSRLAVAKAVPSGEKAASITAYKANPFL